MAPSLSLPLVEPQENPIAVCTQGNEWISVAICALKGWEAEGIERIIMREVIAEVIHTERSRCPPLYQLQIRQPDLMRTMQDQEAQEWSISSLWCFPLILRSRFLIFRFIRLWANSTKGCNGQRPCHVINWHIRHSLASALWTSNSILILLPWQSLECSYLSWPFAYNHWGIGKRQ